jgi:hypothetical protein
MLVRTPSVVTSIGFRLMHMTRLSPNKRWKGVPSGNPSRRDCKQDCIFGSISETHSNRNSLVIIRLLSDHLVEPRNWANSLMHILIPSN